MLSRIDAGGGRLVPSGAEPLRTTKQITPGAEVDAGQRDYVDETHTLPIPTTS
jgi:hypothetical protein